MKKIDLSKWFLTLKEELDEKYLEIDEIKNIVQKQKNIGSVQLSDAKKLPYFIVEGLPVEDTKNIDKYFLSLSFLLGMPFSHEKEGELIMKITPEPKEDNAVVPAYNNTVKFDLHSELPYVNIPPDYISLLCIINDVNIGTNITSIYDVLEQLDNNQLKLLEEPAYKVLIPPHFNAETSHAPKRPLVSPDNDMYSLHVRFDGIQSDSEEHMQALESFKKIADMSIIEAKTSPGQVLMINNKLALHGRNSLTIKNQQTRRELRRIYISSDVEKYGSSFNEKTYKISGF